MAPRLNDLNLEKTKETLDKFLNQAKESVKILEALQKEGLAKAKSLLPTDKQISEGLKKMGLATRSEVKQLEKKVEELASELRSQISKISKKQSKQDQNHEANL